MALLLGIAFLCACVHEGEASAKHIDLGGHRRVRGTVASKGEDYLVTLRLLPVRCFDVATNAVLNREKARHAALQVLDRYLGEKKPVDLFISGAVVATAGMDGQEYRLTMRVPKAGVRVIPLTAQTSNEPDRRSQEKADRIFFSSNFFSAKQDHIDTADRLAAILLAELRTREREPRKGEQSFYVAISEFEDAAGKRFDDLLADVQADRLLLGVEKEEVIGEINGRRKELLLRLKEAVKRYDAYNQRIKSP